jgi:hypothetical protein
MNTQEYEVWVRDARNALSGRYSEVEVNVIMDWFRRIKGQDERDLIGNAEVEAMLVFTKPQGLFDLYNSLMARAFVYAPLILKEARELGEL